jgi:hypothetical protein
MNKLRVFFMISAILISTGALMAQKLKSGDLKMLKGESVLNIQYDYSKMMIGKKTAEEYEADGIADRNKKKPGSGDEWAEKWKSDRTERWHPAFERNFNLVSSILGLNLRENANDAKYTMIVRVTFYEPGFQSGVGISKPASINTSIDLVETSSPDKVLANIEYNKITSHGNMMGFDYDTGSRVQGCFERAGEEMASFVYKYGLK